MIDNKVKAIWDYDVMCSEADDHTTDFAKLAIIESRRKSCKIIQLAMARRYRKSLRKWRLNALDKTTAIRIFFTKVLGEYQNARVEAFDRWRIFMIGRWEGVVDGEHKEEQMEEMRVAG